jgi:Ca2+-binding EF-hand superfamily protein
MLSERGRRELWDKVGTLVRTRFGGSYQVAFARYDRNQCGQIDREGLVTLLADAGVGGHWTRPDWAAAVFAEVERDGEGLISWPEFATVFGVEEPTPDLPALAMHP